MMQLCRVFKHVMVTLEEKIAKAQRLLRLLDNDQPYMNMRLSVLGAEQRQAANDFAGRVRAEAQAELQRLLAERAMPWEWTVPQPAD